MKKQIKILDSKLKFGFWDLGPKRNRKFLPVENYSSILGTDFAFQKNRSRYDLKHKSQFLANYYYSEPQEMAIAQVVCKKEEDDMLTQLNISTYCVYQESVLLINRFDLKGSAHLCNFSIFSGKERELYEQYFTDIIKDGVPLSCVPHIHFQTKTQDENLKQPNPISLNKLIDYLKDLDEGKEDLLQYDLGMPFLDYKLGKKQYTSPFLSLFERLTESFSEDELVDFIKKYKAESKDLSVIQEIQRDVILLQDLVAEPNRKFLNTISAFKFISCLLHNNPEEQSKAESNLLDMKKIFKNMYFVKKVPNLKKLNIFEQFMFSDYKWNKHYNIMSCPKDLKKDKHPSEDFVFEFWYDWLKSYTKNIDTKSSTKIDKPLEKMYSKYFESKQEK